MELRELKEYKQEIFRRSAEKRTRRRRVYKEMGAAGLSLVICVGLMAITLRRPPMAEPEAEQMDKFSAGSVVCTYVRAEICRGDEVLRVTDKAAVTAVFTEVFDTNGYENYVMPGEGQGYTVTLYEPDGRAVSFVLGQERGKGLMQRLEEMT